MLSTLENLIKLARERKLVPLEGSYTNKLLTDKALSKAKVLEEIDELIEAVEFQIPEKSNYQKHPNPASRYAIVGVYLAKYKKEVNVAVTGAKSFVYIDKDLSKKLSSSFSPAAIEGMEVKSSGMNSDMHASAEYRANLVSLYAKKAVEAC